MFWGEYMSEQYQEPLKGTTTVGLVFEDGVVLATEKRATMGYMIASKKAKKVYQIADRIGMTIAGGVGDAQQIARINRRVQSLQYQEKRCRLPPPQLPLPSEQQPVLPSMSSSSWEELMTPTGLFSVDAMGGATKEEEIVATGSGSPMAYGVLEDRFTKGMKRKDAISLAVRAVRAAMKRDAGSGEGVHVVVITKDEYFEVPEDQLPKNSAAATA